MDLLQQELNKNKDSKMSTSKKIVLISLILCIVLLVLILIIMFLINVKQGKDLILSIDENNVQITDNMFISNENGVTYISLSELSEKIGYNYLRGGYLEYIEDENKCYLQNDNQIIGFEADSKKIYKTNIDSSTDYQYYELKNDILKNNEVLYIALEDLNVGCNVVYNFSEETNTITINTIDYMFQYYTTQSENQSITVPDQLFDNMKTISYGMLIVSNNNSKLGVVDLNQKSLIGNKYDTIKFDEFTQNFIVSDENKYGVISKDGKISIELLYQDIEIINYSPLLYKVKQNNKFGILNENGNMIINTEYDRFGTAKTNENEAVLIIKNIGNNKQDGIVVNSNNKFGIIDINTGETIVECTLDNIFYKRENNNIIYYVQIENGEFMLDEYINNAKTIVVNM